MADKRAESKFHQIMQIIRMKESKDKNKLNTEIEEGSDLISYNEFYDAIKNTVNILPRTPSLQDVLL